MVNATKFVEWVKWCELPLKEWILSIKNCIKKVVKKVLKKVQWSPILILFWNGVTKTILKNVVQQFVRVIMLKPKLCIIYIELSKQKWLLPLKSNTHIWYHIFANMLRYIWNPKISFGLQFSQWNSVGWCS